MTSLTVAVATRGRPEALARCLEAIEHGSERPDEVLVVDQAPSPASLAAMDRLISTPHRYLTHDEIGLSASRNFALSETRHAVLAVTDDDCVPDVNWVHRLRASFARPDCAPIVTGAVIALGVPDEHRHAASERVDPLPGRHRSRRSPWRIGTGGNFAAHTDVLRLAGGWDPRLGTGSPGRAAEDLELIDRLLGLGHVIDYRPDVVVRHQLLDTHRRLATRWSYGFGTGAFFGMLLRRRDTAVAPMLFDYLRMHLVAGTLATFRGDGFDASQHARSVVALVPGAWYGLRLEPRRGTAV